MLRSEYMSNDDHATVLGMCGFYKGAAAERNPSE